MATLAELLAAARADSDLQYKSGSAQANTAYNQNLASIQQALNNALANEQRGITDAENMFAEQQAQIQQDAYNSGQATDLTAHMNGINHSQQYLAQMQGNQYRTAQLNQANSRDRSQRLNDIANRINTLKSNAEFDKTQQGIAYNNQLAGLRAESDLAYNQRAGALNEANWQHGLSLETLAKNQAFETEMFGKKSLHDIDMLNRQNAHDILMFDKESALQRSLSSLRASAGGGGGGGGTPTAVKPAAQKSLGAAVNTYNTLKTNTSLDNYYQTQQKLRSTSTGGKPLANNALANLSPIKAPARNPNLSAAQTANMFRKAAGVSTGAWLGKK